MTQLNPWFDINKLTLNTTKIYFTNFKSNSFFIVQNQIDSFKIQHRKNTFNQIFSVILDEHLIWNQQINEVYNKLKSLLHILYNIRRYIKKKPLYYTPIYSRIRYDLLQS